MARGEIKIPIAVDTSGIDKSINNGLVEPLEDAEKALKALEKVDAGKDLEKDLKKASKATDDLKDELDDTRDQLKKLGYAAKDAGDDAKRGMDGASEGAKDFKEEASQSAKEAAASFDGSADSIIDYFQEVAAQAFAGFGPAGALAGLAIAAGIGLAVGEFQKAADAAEELRQKAVEYASDARDAGVSTEAWVRGAERIMQRIQELEETKSTDFRWFWEEDPSQLKKWEDGLKGIGRGADEVNEVLSASDDVLKEYRKSLQRSQDALKDEIDLRRETVDITNEAENKKTQALIDEYEAHQQVLSAVKSEVDLRKEAADSSKRQSDAGIDAAKAQMEAEQEKADAIASAEQSVQDSVTSAYDNMRSAASEYATNEAGALDIGRWLSYMEEHRAATEQYQSNLQNMKLSPEQWTNLMEMPEDARMSWVAQFAALPEEARAPYSAALNDLGSSGGSEAAVGFDESFNPKADVEIKVDSSKAKADLEDTAKKRTAEIAVKTSGTAEAKSALDALAAKRYASIQVSADVSDANYEINAMRRSQENRPIYITVYKRSGGDQLV